MSADEKENQAERSPESTPAASKIGGLHGLFGWKVPIWFVGVTTFAMFLIGIGASGLFNQVLNSFLGAPEAGHPYYEITDCGSQEKACVRFSGQMSMASAHDLMKIAGEQHAKEVRFDSGGGDVDQVSVLRSFFDSNNILAVVKNGHSCVSACALLFSQLAHIAPEPDAEFGFHAERKNTKNAYYILNMNWSHTTWSERTIMSMEKDLGGFGKGSVGKENLINALRDNNALYHPDVKYIKWNNLVQVIDRWPLPNRGKIFRDFYETKADHHDAAQNRTSFRRLSTDPEVP